MERAYRRPGRRGRFIDDVFHGRKVRIYLPEGYDPQSGKRYPVVYMTDGQDMFEDPNEPDALRRAFWDVDLAVDRLQRRTGKSAIVVAVWHSYGGRMFDYLAKRVRGNGGGADAHVGYFADRLKPWIDARFRTRPEAAHTTIGGSSLGGAFALWAGLTRPEVFLNVVAESPSLWPGRYQEASNGPILGHSWLLDAVASRPDLSHFARSPEGRAASKDLRIYVASGAWSEEGRRGAADGHRDLFAFRDLLERRGFRHGDNLLHWFHFTHAHNQKFWKLPSRFPRGLEFALQHSDAM